jgi:hypothetical protein
MQNEKHRVANLDGPRGTMNQGQATHSLASLFDSNRSGKTPHDDANDANDAQGKNPDSRPSDVDDRAAMSEQTGDGAGNQPSHDVDNPHRPSRAPLARKSDDEGAHLRVGMSSGAP